MKRVLITGATSGIGFELAKRYADDGWLVYACGRNELALEKLTHQHSHMKTLCFDITDQQQTYAALHHIETAFNLIILNAGTCEYIDAGQIDSALFRRVFDVNLFGVLHCLEALQHNFSEHTHLAIMGSTAAYLPFARAEAYGASKAAIQYLTHSLAVDLHAKGTLVSLVSPGFVKTPLTDKNDFAMPMIINTTEAASYIKKGLDNKKEEVHFPFKFSCLLKCIAMLPIGLQRKLLIKLARESS